MTVQITSYVAAQAGGNDKIYLQVPSGVGSISITDVIGLVGALSGKLDDTLSIVGTTNVTATGADLNSIAGIGGIGLGTTEFQWLFDTVATGVTPTEVSYNIGLTGNVQAQLDTKYDQNDFTTNWEIIVGTGAMTAVITPFILALNAHAISDLGTALANVNMGGFGITAMLDPVNPQDAATKNYVDVLMGGVGGPYLPLDGTAAMTGDLDMGSQNIITVGNVDGRDVSADGSTLDTHVGDASIHFIINDAGTSTTEAWSADKISTELSGKAGTGHAHTWLSLSDTVGTFGSTGDVVVVNGAANGLEFASPGSLNAVSSVFTRTGAVVAQNGDYNASAITNIPAGTIAAVTVQGALNELDGDVGQRLKLDGTTAMTGALDMGTNLISNVVDPVGAQDAATRGWVLTQVGAGGPFLPLSGGTMTGDAVFTGADIILDGSAIEGKDSSTSTSGNAEDVIVRAGDGDLPVNSGGTVSIHAGDGTTSGGPIGLVGGDGDNGPGGSVIVEAGDGTAFGGVVLLDAGDASSGDGGHIRFWPGVGTANDGFVAIMTPGLAGTVPPELRFYDGINVAPSNYVGFKGPLSLGADTCWTLPTADGTADQVLTTNGSEVLSWSGPYLPIDGTVAMTGDLDMGGNNLTNLGLTSFGNHVFNLNDYQSAEGGQSFFIRTSATPGPATPTYSFLNEQTTGWYHDSINMKATRQGTDVMEFGAGVVDVKTNRVVNAADPVNDQDVVTKAFMEAQTPNKVLGLKQTIDLVGGSVLHQIHTVPTGKTHIFTHVVVRARTYNPTGLTTNATVSFGTNNPNYDDIVDTETLDWGVGGAADQAVYALPKQGAATPNAAAQIWLRVNTQSDQAALVVDVYLLGLEVNV